MTAEEIRGALEAILFVAGEPVSLEQLSDALGGEPNDAIAAELEIIRQRLDDNGSGINLEQTAGGYRFATRPAVDPFLRKFFARQGEARLSMAGLETLAIVAYRQPITAPEINEIRGVNSSGVLRTLLDRHMVRIAGRKPVVGSPFLYRTTREFLVHFGLNTIQDLPKLEEFSEMLGVNLPEEMVLPDEIPLEGDFESEEAQSAGASGDEHGEEDRGAGNDERAAAKAGSLESHANMVELLDDDSETSAAAVLADAQFAHAAYDDLDTDRSLESDREDAPKQPSDKPQAVSTGEDDRKPVEFPSNDQD